MKYIKGFDSLRAISIIIVILFHLGITQKLFEDGRLNFFFTGNAGVNIFFCISGFLITSLLYKEYEESGRINLKYFFIRRFLRLLPPLIPFYFTLLFFMFYGISESTYLGVLFSVFYLYNFVPYSAGLFSKELSHTWSLAVEEQFYIYWAMAFAFLRKNSLLISAIVIIVLSVVAYYLLDDLIIFRNDQEIKLKDLFFPGKWTIPAISSIMVGSLMAYFNNLKNNLFSKVNGSYFILLLGVFLIMSPLFLPIFLIPVESVIHAFGVALLLLWIYHNQESKIVDMLEFRPIKYIGVISYGLYIWQGLFVRNGPEKDPKYLVHEMPYNVILAFLVAILSYELLEKKILKYKVRYKV